VKWGGSIPIEIVPCRNWNGNGGGGRNTVPVTCTRLGGVNAIDAPASSAPVWAELSSVLTTDWALWFFSSAAGSGNVPPYSGASPTVPLAETGAVEQVTEAAADEDPVTEQTTDDRAVDLRRGSHMATGRPNPNGV